MSTETTVQSLKINKLTKAQFDTITPSATEAYELTDLSSILDGKQTKSNLVTSVSASSTDAQYPSAKCVYDALQNGGLSYSATCPTITISSGVATWAVTHNLGTQNVVVSLYNVSTGNEIEKNVTITSNNAISVAFKASSNVSAGAYKIVVIGADNSVVQYRQSNIITTGALTNDRGVISGFSTSNYASVPILFNPESATWEQVYKFKTGSSLPSTYQRITGTPTDYYGGALIVIANSTLTMWATSNNSSWNIANGGGTGNILSTNTTYWAKLAFTGTQYILSYSTDGINYTAGVIVNSSLTVKALQYLSLGVGSGNYPFNGLIDLNESYIKVAGSYWWKGTIEV